MQQIVSCPCSKYANFEAVVNALGDCEQTAGLIEWLSGRVVFATESSSECKDMCKGRVQTAFAIINAVRDATRDFLDQTASLSSNGADSARKAPRPAFEDEFPALEAPSQASTFSNTPEKGFRGDNKPVVRKVKKRIRPAVVSSGHVPREWGNLVSQSEEDTTGFKSKNELTVPSSDLAEAQALAKSMAITTTPKKERPRNTSFLSTPPTVEAATNGVCERRGVSGEIVREKDSLRMPQLTNLVAVYVALIDNCLVVSSILELHLLFRLLVVVPEQPFAHQKSPLLGGFFASHQQCMQFAKECLQRLSRTMLGLGQPLWNVLVQCSPFGAALPQFRQELVNRLEKFELTPINHFAMSLENQATAHITLPFRYDRDSRNNFKTHQEQALYKNRESARDAFLYQLRTFLNAKGKVVDAAKVKKINQSIQQSSRNVVMDLMSVNFSWFSEFFTDLLLQIGHVPVQETDKEIIKIVDKGKLQKLHRRFSSRNHVDKGTRRVSAEPPRKRGSLSPEAEAQSLFPGYQEFFFLFLASSDSYSFNLHLRGHLVWRLKQKQDASSLEDTEKTLLDLCLLARFLGLLVFSPNWREEGLLSHIPLRESRVMEGMEVMSNLSLPIEDTIRSAERDDKLGVVIPWVIDLLRLSVWDGLTRSSKRFADVLSLLRRIQIRCAHGLVSSSPGDQFVSLVIESFVGEYVGLLQTLKQTRSKSFRPGRLVSQEENDLPWGQLVMYHFVPHAKELILLIESISRPSRGALKSPSVPRKVRPSPLSPLSSQSPSPAARSDERDTKDKGNSFLFKLQGQFFHDHKELKEICEFVVSRSLQQIARNPLDVCEGRDAWKGSNSHDSLRTFLKDKLRDRTAEIVKVLSPPNACAMIQNIAVSIAVEQGLSDAFIASIVPMLPGPGDAVSVEKKLFPEKLDTKEGGGKMDHSVLFVHATESIDKLTTILSSLTTQQGEQDSLLAAIDVLSDLHCHLDLIGANESSSETLHDDVLRSFFSSVFDLDVVAVGIVPDMVHFDSWELIEGLLVAAVKLLICSRRGLRDFTNRIRNTQLLKALVVFGLERGRVEGLAAALSGLIQSGVLTKYEIEGAIEFAARKSLSNASSLQHILWNE